MVSAGGHHGSVQQVPLACLAICQRTFLSKSLQRITAVVPAYFPILDGRIHARRALINGQLVINHLLRYWNGPLASSRRLLPARHIISSGDGIDNCIAKINSSTVSNDSDHATSKTLNITVATINICIAQFWWACTELGLTQTPD